MIHHAIGNAILAVILAGAGVAAGGQVTIHAGSPARNSIVAARLTRATQGAGGVSGQDAVITARYFDGLGREVQSVTGSSQGGTAPDLADYTEYNDRGRVSRKWLPAPTPGRAGMVEFCRLDLLQASHVEHRAEHACHDSTCYERTPMARVVETRAPGQAWQSHEGVRREYCANTAGGMLSCQRFSAGGGTLRNSGKCAPGTLQVVKNTDEDGHVTLVFTDMHGHAVLSRRVLGQDFADTYYVYDFIGNLRYVLPPKASAALVSSQGDIPDTDDAVARLCYAYKYDSRGRRIEKKLPGCEPVYYVYDSCDNLVYWQDGNQRERGRWSFTAYDALGRTAYSGQAAEPRDAVQLRESYRARSPRTRLDGSADVGYAIVNDGVTAGDIIKANYYDSYAFLGTQDGDSLALRAIDGYDASYSYSSAAGSTSAKGLLTGTLTRVLGGDGALLTKSFYYDTHGNVVQTHEQNAMGGYEHYYYRLSFTGNPLAVRHEHTTADTINVEIMRYTYDNMERLLTATVERDGAAPVLLCGNTLDELGRLARQVLGGTAGGGHAEAVDYAYNVRGWTLGITAGHFRQQLRYEDPGATGAAACYNGNVSAVEWTALSSTAAETPETHSYAYSYDGLDRLTGAVHRGGSPGTFNGSLLTAGALDYTCAYSYDLNGNATSITRRGVSEATGVMGYTCLAGGAVDELSLSYEGNQLRRVTDQCAGLAYEGAMDFRYGADAATEYTYDACGNMASDCNKGVHSVSYNVLNLPQTVRFADGHETRYTYDADGRKLRVEHLLNNTRFINPGLELAMPAARAALPGLAVDTVLPIPAEQTLLVRDYCAGHVYRGGRLERVLNGVGYSDSAGYHYYVRDYRGDVRAVVADDGTLEEVNHYYPYGMLHGPSAIAAGVQPHKYTGKELDREAGLDLYDFAARQLDPALGRTTTQDPMDEKYYSISPYAWCASNPISNVDPSGMYYNSADSTQAAMYINMLEGRKKALDESDVTDKNEQLAEIDKSLQDIEDMRNDPNRRYTFQEADAPETTVLKDGTILMKISPETGGNFAHEIRHGGQVARGEYGYVKNEPDSRYGASHEISAYRAQLSSYGKISYMPDYGGDKMIELKIAVYGQMHVWKTITNLDEISVNFIMSICEGPGLNVKPIYKYGKEWFGR